ncbi:hypothetical protein FF2_015614 [Malus domestica]
MIVLPSGLLPNPELETSVLSISLNTAAMVWMIPFGLSSAVSTRVSNELGAGRPETACLAKIGAYVNLGAYYLVGIPLAILMAFVFHAGGKGLWLGIICALIVQVLLLLIVTIRTNWEKQANKATERVSDSTVHVDIVS